MFAFPSMLVNPAKEAGMKVPEDAENFDPHDFPHFQVYLIMQVGRPIPHTDSHWTNAKIIAAVPDDKIKELTVPELMALGLEIGRPIP